MSTSPVQMNNEQQVLQTLGATRLGTFYPVVFARVAAGRSRARLVYEVKPLGQIFDGSGLGFGEYSDIGLLGTNLALPVSGLANGAYHWRARLQYFPHMNYSPWYSTGNNGSNETDFLVLPDATATATATFTPTVTSTPTGTPTATSTVLAPVINATATATPTVPPVNTGVPTFTPAPTIIPTATPLPTIAADVIAAFLTANNQPLANALVFIEGLGVAITDSQGYFEFRGVKSAGNYIVVISASGLSGKQTATLSSGSIREINLEREEYNPYACLESNQDDILAQALEDVQKLFEIGKGNMRVLRKRSGLNATAERLSQALQKRLNSYLSELSEVPTVVLDCGRVTEAACRQRSLVIPFTIQIVIACFFL